jgi:hypothetical protein
VSSQLYCPDETRLSALRDYPGGPPANGIDYLEVRDHEAPPGWPRQQLLLVHCLEDVGALTEANVLIEGGVRVRNVRAVWARRGDDPAAAFLAPLPAAERKKILLVRTDARGDFSTYTLRLVATTAEPDVPAPSFDPILYSVRFSFKVECESDFDCKTVDDCAEPVAPEPAIDYLARDYESFRGLMLDRLAVVAPGWQERNPADLGVAVVELLAYAADRISYHQDAVATEAYLGTARRRTSVRRHARLVDYRLHDGASARAWACVSVDDTVGTAELLAGTQLVTAESGAVPAVQSLGTDAAARSITFETLHNLTALSLRNEIALHTWADPDCCLPRGATRATLVGTNASLALAAGDVVLFEEVLSDEGVAGDADPLHRHPVRLIADPVDAQDPIGPVNVVEIAWAAEDALPFTLCLRQFSKPGGGTQGATVVRGNVVLAQNGRLFQYPLPLPVEGHSYRPTLDRLGLAHKVAYVDRTARTLSASAATVLDPRAALPWLELTGDDERWEPRSDLLASGRFATDFVVEMEEDGRATLRFGDGILGREPGIDTLLTATYRTGDGAAGNVGAEALTQAVTTVDGVGRVRNPLPAVGGADPEPIEQARLYAPEAFRRQERAVTEADYATIAERHPDVQRAAATRRWTGSWYTMFVSVDRRGGLDVDQVFRDALAGFLEHYRLAGYDVEIEPPLFVPLDVELPLCVAPGYVRADVRKALLDAFSSRDLTSGRRGFFHPDSFTFGQPVHLSRIVAAAMAVVGVESVGTPIRFQRFGRVPLPGEDERIAMGRLEIARLDNDPNRPENGRIDFALTGGV